MRWGSCCLDRACEKDIWRAWQARFAGNKILWKSLIVNQRKLAISAPSFGKQDLMIFLKVFLTENVIKQWWEGQIVRPKEELGSRWRKDSQKPSPLILAYTRWLGLSVGLCQSVCTFHSSKSLTDSCYSETNYSLSQCY